MLIHHSHPILEGSDYYPNRKSIELILTVIPMIIEVMASPSNPILLYQHLEIFYLNF